MAIPTVELGRPPESIEQAVELFMADCRARNLSESTLTLNRIILRGLSDYLGDLPIASITSDVIRRFLIGKSTDTSPATAARYYDTIKKLFGFLEQEGFLLSNPMCHVVKPRAPMPIIEPLTQAQIEAMIQSCPDTFAGIRDRLIILILADCGLRASELASLQLRDIDMETRQILVRHGKGNRSRRVPFGKAVHSAIRMYFARRVEVDSPYLLITVYGDKLDRYRVRAIIRTAARRAGIEHPHMGPHLIRHSMACLYLKHGGTPFHLQMVLGHSTLQMVRRYVTLSNADLSEMHETCSPADRLECAKQQTARRRLR